MTTYTSEPGTRLGGRYRLEDRTAAGSGWDAWKAIDETLARAVTVFTFAQGFPRITDVVTAARAASRLTDSRLAQVFDVEDAWEQAYIVMEWAAGESLGDLLSAGPLEPDRGARIIAEASAALASAHAAGIAHMCLSPACIKWSQTGEVKVTGLGVDAALAGVTSEEPVLADTRGLGNLLYAALTGCWPGADEQSLPPAPQADGHPRSPRQVIAGIPAVFSDLTCRAMQLPSGVPVITTPGELSSGLMAVLPPAPIPSAPPPPVRRERTAEYGSDPYWPGRKLNGEWSDDHQPGDYRPTGYEETGWQRQAAPERQARRPEPGGHRAPSGRAGREQRTLPFVPGNKLPLAILAGIGTLVAVAAVTAVVLWPGGTKAPTTQQKSGPSAPAAVITSLTPVKATGFDPLTSVKRDPYNENSQDAHYAIDSNPQTAWTTQWYNTAEFGGLKAGSGLMLEMPKAETYRSAVVTFGPVPGADVKILIGNSDARSAANLDSMTTVAQASDVAGKITFRITSSAKGKFLLIWFTKLAPKAGSGHWYDGEVLNVSVRGIG
ncbi:MAG TPA: protein kinase family protein [Streptosporangiaceae bacterium]|nr:protein kinase family protein [Streptosporangiaceae bacterium]